MSDKCKSLAPRGTPLVADISVFPDYLRSRGSVTVPGFRIARRVTSLRWARGLIAASLADSVSEWDSAATGFSRTVLV